MTPGPGHVAVAGDGGDCDGGADGGNASGACDEGGAADADAAVAGDDGGGGETCDEECAGTTREGLERSPVALSRAALAHFRFDYDCSEMRMPAIRDPRPADKIIISDTRPITNSIAVCTTFAQFSYRPGLISFRSKLPFKLEHGHSTSLGRISFSARS